MLKTSIIGKPNVGKSSLLNKLINEDKAIVTDIEGTAKLVVEGKISIRIDSLNIIDTAGIKIISWKYWCFKSLELYRKFGSLILYVLSMYIEISQKELEILEKIREKNYIVVVNK